MSTTFTVGDRHWVPRTILVVLFSGFALFAIWFQTWVVELRCEHGGNATVRCTSTSRSLLHAREEVVEARDVEGARVVWKTRVHSRGRTHSNLSLMLYGAGGLETRIPINNINVLWVRQVHELDDTLSAWVHDPEAPPLELQLQSPWFLRLMIGSLVLFLPLAIFSLGRHVTVTVDCAAGTLVIQKRFFKAVRHSLTLPLSHVVGANVRGLGRHRKLVLDLHHHDPIALAHAREGNLSQQADALNALIGTQRTPDSVTTSDTR